MKKSIISLLVVILISCTAFAQHKINTALKQQLDSVMLLDQKYRDTLSLFMTPGKGDSIAKKLSLKPWQAMNRYSALQGRLDSL